MNSIQCSSTSILAGEKVVFTYSESLSPVTCKCDELKLNKTSYKDIL